MATRKAYFKHINQETIDAQQDISIAELMTRANVLESRATQLQSNIDSNFVAVTGSITDLRTYTDGELLSNRNYTDLSVSNLSTTVTNNYNSLSTDISGLRTYTDGQLSTVNDTITSNYNYLLGQISDVANDVSTLRVDTNTAMSALESTLTAAIATAKSEANAYTDVLRSETDASFNAVDTRITALKNSVDASFNAVTDAAAARITVENEFYTAFRDGIFLENPAGSNNEYDYSSLLTGATPTPSYAINIVGIKCGWDASMNGGNGGDYFDIAYTSSLSIIAPLRYAEFPQGAPLSADQQATGGIQFVQTATVLTIGKQGGYLNGIPFKYYIGAANNKLCADFELTINAGQGPFGQTYNNWGDQSYFTY